MQKSSNGYTAGVGVSNPLLQQRAATSSNVSTPESINIGTHTALKRVHMLSPPRSASETGSNSNPSLNSANSTGNGAFEPNLSHNISTTTVGADGKVFHGEVNTKIACLTCREKKLKCDKLLPVCSRCAKKNCPCIYVEHKKTGPKPNSVFRAKKHDLSSSSNENSETENANTSIGAPVSARVNETLSPGVNASASANANANANASANASGKKVAVRWKRVKTTDPYSSVFSQPEHQQQQLHASPSPSQARIPVLNFMNLSTNTAPTTSPSSHYYGQPLVSSNTADLRNTHYSDRSKLDFPKANNSASRQTTLDSSGDNHNFNDNTNTSNMINDGNPNDTTNNDHGIRHTSINTNKNNINNQARKSHRTSVEAHMNQHTKQKISENFNTNLTNLTNKSFEGVIGLPQLNLTMQDVDKFHSFYFNSSTRIFKYSIQRYYNTFVKEPKSILHYSYMIWAMACFYLDEYEYMVEKMYKAALVQMNNYWESNRDSFHSDILTYLHALCLKSQFEFLSGREMRAALTVASSIRLTQMYGYDQIDLSPTTLGSPAIFFRSISLSSEKYESTNTLLQDDNLDPDIPLVEERRRVLWEVFAIDKWSSLVTGLPCALSVDSLSVIFTKLPSPTTFLPLNNDSDMSEPENEQSSFYLHEAMQKLDNNQVLLDINSSSSKILLLTISENIIKWCKMFLNMVELETLKSQSSIDSIRNKVDELVRNFESMHNNLLFFDLTTEPLMNIVITNTSTLLYQSVLIKFGSLFDLQFKEDPTGANIHENEIKLFKDILYEVSAMSEKLVSRFMKKSHIENHLKKAPVFIVFINSIKSLFQCIAFVYRFNDILHVDEERKNSLLETIKSCAAIINGMSTKIPLVEKTKDIINNGQELLDHSPHLLSFFDSFFDSPKSF